MKILRYMSFAVAAALLATSCSEELNTYTGRDNVYFFFGRGYTGVLSMADMTPGNALTGYSTGFDYARIDFDTGPGAVADTVVSVQIFCNGPLADHDREVAVVADPENNYTEDAAGKRKWDTSAREGTEFEILGASILAGKPYGYVRVRLIHTDSLRKAGVEGLDLRLKLMPNENFGTDFDLTPVGSLNSAVRSYYHLNGRMDENEKPLFDTLDVRRYNTLNYRLNFNDDRPISPLWRQGITGESYRRMKNMFGEYSVRKLEFINEVFNFEWTYLFPTDEMIAASGGACTPTTYVTNTLGWSNTVAASPIMRGLNKAMALWKEENKGKPDIPHDADGNPMMMDESGKEVTFPMTGII